METIGRYNIKKEIARGGMGEIYLAEDTNLNREVAIKVLISSLTYETTFTRRFEREARMVAPLEHPNIVPLYDFGVDTGSDRPYLVMRLMRGGTLEERAGSMTESEIWLMVEQISAALDYAHNHGVVHRDIKPSNILYDRNGNAYLTDFGIAKSAQSNQTRLTGAKIIGTPHYMSPEQCLPNMTPDGKSDQYSMAILVFELLAGRPPFDGDTMALLYQHVNEDVPIEFLEEKGIPSHVVDALVKALAKEPEDRFPDMHHFVNAILGRVPVGKVPTRARSGRREKSKTGSRAAEKPTAVQSEPRQSRGWILWIAGLVGLLGLASILYNQFSDRLTSTQVVINPTAVLDVVEIVEVTAAPTDPPPLPTDTQTPLPTETSTPLPTATLPPTPNPLLDEVTFSPSKWGDAFQLINNQFLIPEGESDQIVLISDSADQIEIVDVNGGLGYLDGAGIIGLYFDDNPESYRFEVHCLVGVCGLEGGAADERLMLAEGEAARLSDQGDVTALRTGASYDAFRFLSSDIPAVAIEAAVVESPTPLPPTPTETPAVQVCNHGLTFIEGYTYDNPANKLQAPQGISLRITFVLENSGDCAWEETFTLGPIEEGEFGSRGAVEIGQVVSPGEQLVLEIDNLQTPNQPGTYSGALALRTEDGTLIEPPILFDLGVYARATATPDVTPTSAPPAVGPTIPAEEVQALDFLFSVSNCSYPGNGTEYRCDLTITAYGGGQGDTYTVWVNDSDPMARYYPVNGPVLHLFQARRCAKYIQEIIVQSDVTGERISKNIFFDPQIEALFPGGTTCVKN